MEEYKKEEVQLPFGLKLVSWLWLFSGGMTAIMLVFTVIFALSDGYFYLFGFVLGLFTAAVKIGPFICIYKKTPQMYDNLKVFFWLNVAQLVLSNILAFQIRALFTVFLLFWFWSDYKNERTRQYFGCEEAVKVE